MNALTAIPSPFDTTLDQSGTMTSFTTSKGQVYLAGSVLSDHRIDDLLTFFERKEAEAEKAAKEARAAFNALWDRRCEAMNYRHDHRPARSHPRCAPKSATSGSVPSAAGA